MENKSIFVLYVIAVYLIIRAIQSHSYPGRGQNAKSSIKTYEQKQEQAGNKDLRSGNKDSVMNTNTGNAYTQS